MHQLQAIQMHMQTGMNPLASPFNPINPLNVGRSSIRQPADQPLRPSEPNTNSAASDIPGISCSSPPSSTHSPSLLHSSSSQDIDHKPSSSVPFQPGYATNHNFHLPLGVTMADLNSGHLSGAQQQAVGLSDPPTQHSPPFIAEQPSGVSEQEAGSEDSGVSGEEVLQGRLGGGGSIQEEKAGAGHSAPQQPNDHPTTPSVIAGANNPAASNTSNSDASHSRGSPPTVSLTQDDAKMQGTIQSGNVAYAGAGTGGARLSDHGGHQAALGTPTGSRLGGGAEALPETRSEGEMGYEWVLPLSASSVGLSQPAESSGESTNSVQ